MESHYGQAPLMKYKTLRLYVTNSVFELAYICMNSKTVLLTCIHISTTFKMYAQLTLIQLNNLTKNQFKKDLSSGACINLKASNINFYLKVWNLKS